MAKNDKMAVGKGAAYIYIENVIAAITGYGLWLLLSRITSTEVIGTTSTVISLATIFSTIVAIGIPNSIPRFLGRNFSDGKIEDARVFVKGSIFIVFSGIVIAAVIISFFAGYWILKSLNFTLTALTILLMGSTAMSLLLRNMVIASLRTKALVTREIVFSAAKVGLSVILILTGYGAIGLVLGYTIGQILVTFLLASVLRSFLRSDEDRISNTSFISACKSILSAGIPSWIPALITTIGSQLGTVVVFQAAGASQAGSYFIAFSIATGITTITYSMLSATFPALSAMVDGRKRFAWQFTKSSLALTIPLSSAVVFYSGKVMALFGPGYINGSLPLEILLLSVLPATFTTGINILVYAYGNYRQVLIIGLASSIPRTILYFVLVPLYGNNGSAISYTIGSVIAFAVCIIISKRIGMIISWKDLIWMFIIPTGMGYVLSSLGINYIAGILITVVISYLLLLRLQVLTRLDIQDLLVILPHNISTPVNRIMNRLGKKLNKSY